MAQDWFSQNAPTSAPAGGSGDWFSSNAPASASAAPAPSPDLSSVPEINPTAADSKADDVITGIVKGFGDTIHGTGELIRKGGNAVSDGLGDKIVPPGQNEAFGKAMESDNKTQWVGKAIENVAEFGLGEGAVDETGKALTQSGKIQKLGEVAKFLDRHPFLAKMLAGGAKTGLVSGAETAAKTGDPTEGAEGAAVGAVTGGLVNPVAGKGLQFVRDAYKPATELIDASTGLRDVKTVQPVVQKGIRDVAAKAAADAGVTAPTSSSVRDVFADLGDQVKAKSQPVFQAVDDWSEGKFSDAQAAAKKYSGALDAAGKDKFEEALQKQDTLFQQYVKSEGAKFSPADLDKAKQSWSQFRALQRVDDATNGAISGQRPEIAAASGSKQPDETVNPKGLMLRLNRLYRDGTLETALGKDGANALLDHAGAAQQATDDILYENRVTKAQTAARNKVIAEQNAKAQTNRKIIGGTIALGALSGAGAAAGHAGYKAIKNVVSGQ